LKTNKKDHMQQFHSFGKFLKQNYVLIQI